MKKRLLEYRRRFLKIHIINPRYFFQTLQELNLLIIERLNSATGYAQGVIRLSFNKVIKMNGQFPESQLH